MKRVYLLTATDPHTLLEDLERDGIPAAIDTRAKPTWPARMGRRALRQALESKGRLLYTIPAASAEVLNKRLTSMGVEKAAVWSPVSPGSKRAYDRLMRLGSELAARGCLVFDPIGQPVLRSGALPDEHDEPPEQLDDDTVLEQLDDVAGDEGDQVAEAEEPEPSVYVNEETNTPAEDTNTPSADDTQPTVTLVLEQTTLVERLVWVALKGRFPSGGGGVLKALEHDGEAEVSEGVARVILSAVDELLEEAGGWSSASPLARGG